MTAMNAARKAARKTARKSTRKKAAARKPAMKKATARKRPVPKKPAPRKTAAKKSTKRAVKKPAAKQPRTTSHASRRAIVRGRATTGSSARAKGYWIAQVTIKDPGTYPRYIAANKAAFDKYGGRFLVRGGAFECVEGQARQRHVVIEFDSYEQALACYHSPEYRAAGEIRMNCAESDLIIAEGTEG